MCEDIRIPLSKSRGYIIEINSSPNIKFHDLQKNGKTIKIADTIVKGLLKKHPLFYSWFLVKQYKYFLLALSCLSGIGIYAFLLWLKVL